MPNLIESCEEHFDTKDLYEVLGIPKSSSDAEVKRAYHKGSLRYHPDRVAESEKDGATKKFQTLGKVYALLSDKDKRAVYDESGEVDEEDEPKDRDWDEYWRLLFPKLTLDDVKKFEEEYKGSEEELEDLKTAYTQYNGDMDRIMESVLCCTYEDEERFQEVLRHLIKTEELPSYPKFSRETKAKKDSRRKRMQQEAAEAEELGKELGLGEGADALTKAIQKRQEVRQKEAGSFIDHLEDKYAKKGAKKGKAATAPKKEKKPSADDEVEDDDDEMSKPGRSKKNGKAPVTGAPSDDDVSEEEKPVAKRGRKPAAEKKAATEAAKESKPARGKRGATAASKDTETEASAKPRSRRAAAKEPKYTENSDDENKEIAKPKGRKAPAKPSVDSDDEAEKKPAAKTKRGAAAKKAVKATEDQEAGETKVTKSARGKKAAAKPAKVSSEEEEDEEDDADPKAKGDGDEIGESNDSDENISSNGLGDGHVEAEEVKTSKSKRAVSQKATKIEPPATKKSKVDSKSKKAKK